MDVAMHWDVAPCSPCVNRRFRETYHFHLQDLKSAKQKTRVQYVDPYYGPLRSIRIHIQSNNKLYIWKLPDDDPNTD